VNKQTDNKDGIVIVNNKRKKRAYIKDAVYIENRGNAFAKAMSGLWFPMEIFAYIAESL
jgi:hypothetical protein